MSNSKGESELTNEVTDLIKRIALTKYGNGKYFLVTMSHNNRLRVELWNEEKTKMLFVFEGEV